MRGTFDKKMPHSSTIRSWYANSNINIKSNELSTEILNILSAKSAEMHGKGEKLVVALKWDEMHIKKNIQYSNVDQKLVGYSCCDGNDDKDGTKKVANQALVFFG